jgi:hypothetical protein
MRRFLRLSITATLSAVAPTTFASAASVATVINECNKMGGCSVSRHAGDNTTYTTFCTYDQNNVKHCKECDDSASNCSLPRKTNPPQTGGNRPTTVGVAKPLGKTTTPQSQGKTGLTTTSNPILTRGALGSGGGGPLTTGGNVKRPLTPATTSVHQ